MGQQDVLYKSEEDIRTRRVEIMVIFIENRVETVIKVCYNYINMLFYL